MRGPRPPGLFHTGCLAQRELNWAINLIMQKRRGPRQDTRQDSCRSNESRESVTQQPLPRHAIGGLNGVA